MGQQDKSDSPLDRFEPSFFSTTKLRPIPPHILVVLMIIASGMYFNMDNPLPAIVLTIVAFGLYSMRSGVEVSINAHTYRDFKSIYWIKFGKWKSLSEYDFILITRNSQRKNAMMNMAYGVSYGDVFYDMDLITKGDRDVLLKRHGSKDLVIEQAIDIGQYFDLRVLERIDGEYYVVYEPKISER